MKPAATLYDPSVVMTFSPRTGDYPTMRRKLLMLVGGVTRACDLRCHHCGRPRRAWVFDHLQTRNYHPRRLNQMTRLRTYYREWVMAGRKVGCGVVVACDPCNSERASLHVHAYTKAARRRRNKGAGRGYSTRDYVEYVKTLAVPAQEEDTPF